MTYDKQDPQYAFTGDGSAGSRQSVFRIVGGVGFALAAVLITRGFSWFGSFGWY